MMLGNRRNRSAEEGKKSESGMRGLFFLSAGFAWAFTALPLYFRCLFFFCLCDINTQRQRLPSWHLPYAPYCFSPFVNCALFLRFLQPFFFVCVFPFCSRSWCFGMLVVCAFYGITFFFFFVLVSFIVALFVRTRLNKKRKREYCPCFSHLWPFGMYTGTPASMLWTS